MESIIEIFTNVGRLLPVTVIGAIVLFVIKEIIEASRRKKINLRKRKAIRRLIADEIERNNWTIKSLRNMVSEIELSIKTPGSSLEIRRGVLGEHYLRINKGGEAYSQSPIRKVHSVVLNENLLQLAEIDEPIFDQALKASDALKELDHVMRSIVTHIGGDDEVMFLEGLVDFARDESEDCERTLAEFYKSVTGRVLREHRLR